MYNHIIIHLCCQYIIKSGGQDTRESSTNVHINYFAPLMSRVY